MVYVLGLKKPALQLYAGRQGSLEFIQGLAHAGGDLGDVGGVLLRRRHEQGPLAIEPCEVSGLVLGPAHIGHIANPHHLAALAGYRNLAYGLDGLEGSAGLDVETSVAGVDGADRRLDPGAAQGVGDGARRQMQLSELGQIKGDPHFRIGRAPVLGLPDARNPVQPVSQSVRHLFQAAHRHVAADHRRLKNGHFGGAGALDLKAGKALGQAAAQGVYLAHDLIVFSLRIDVPGELDPDHRDPVQVRRLHRLDVIKTVNGVLDRLGDQLLHLRRRRARQDRADDNEGDGKVRILGPGNRQQGVEAEHRQ